MNILKLATLMACLAAGCGSMSGCVRSMAPHSSGGGARGGSSATTLYAAAYQGDLDQARYLLDNGALLDAVTSQGMTPLTVAIWREHTGIVSLLINRGVNVNLVTSQYGSTPLMVCGQYGNAEMARMLVRAGANVAAKDNKGKTALYYAADNKRFGVLGVLRKAGLTVPYTGNNKKDMAIAAVSGDKEKFITLLAAGADPNDEVDNDVGRHLLMYAAEWNWPDMVTLLLKKGANPAERDDDNWTATMYAARDSQTEILKAFEQSGVKMSYGEDAKENLLIAVLSGDQAKVGSLLAAGGDVNGLYLYNTPLLSYAVNKKDLAMAKLLLGNKANPNIIADGDYSPFFLSLRFKDLGMVRLMLDHGANVNSRSRTGFTALMYAIAFTDVATVKEMLSKGANPDVFAVNLSQGGNASFQNINMPEITAMIKPDVLRRQMLRAQAAVEAAQSPADLIGAMREYELAKLAAPEAAEIYYNLGLVQDKAGNYSQAIENLNQYLRLAPTANDSQAVKDMVYKLEYKRDLAAGQR